jgi:ABC-type multidrug transport system ATPase subunit
MALLGKPKVILLDEPTTGLDPVGRREFWTVIKSLKKPGRSIILTTHNLEEVEELSDRTAIMSRGKLLITGSNQFIKNQFGIGSRLVMKDPKGSILNVD